MNATENTDLLERLKTLNAKYVKACDALEFVAFARDDIWKPLDRMNRAKNTLLELGEIVKVNPPNEPSSPAAGDGHGGAQPKGINEK